MLGWLHQSIAGEKELLLSLLRKTKSEGNVILIEIYLLENNKSQIKDAFTVDAPKGRNQIIVCYCFPICFEWTCRDF